MTAEETRPTRTEASVAVSDLGWRYVLGALQATVRLASLHQAAEMAARLVHECGTAADDSIRMDLRPGLLLITLRSRRAAAVTGQELRLARLLTNVLHEFGLRPEPAAARTVQALEIAIDALDIPAIRPFWQAVLGYAPDGPPPLEPPAGALADPLDQGPALWFQQLTGPRAGRNRIHLDISVPHDEAPARIAAALAAGGVLVSAARAPAFWILADAEGNEACVSTWQGRD